MLNKDEEKSKLEELCQTTLGSFYSPPNTLQPSTIRTFRHPISRYARRFFFLLLKHNSLVMAYRLAIDLNTRDLFSDLYHCAMEQQEFTLAHICLEKSKQMAIDEREEKTKQEMNRSISSRDDNLDGLVENKDEWVSESEEEVDDEENDRMSLKARLVVGGNSGKLRVFTEADVENYVKEMLESNQFLYKMNLDSF